MMENEWQSNILVRLYQIMFKINILSQIGADRYQKLIFEILLLSPRWRAQYCEILTGSGIGYLGKFMLFL